MVSQKQSRVTWHDQEGLPLSTQSELLAFDSRQEQSCVHGEGDFSSLVPPMKPNVLSVCGPGEERPPAGWSGCIAKAEGLPYTSSPVRGGVYDVERPDKGMVDAGLGASRSPRSVAAACSNAFEGTARMALSLGTFDATAPGRVGVPRPETPILSYVDRASFPGFVHRSANEGEFLQTACDVEVEHPSILRRPVDNQSYASIDANYLHARVSSDDWEEELRAWKRLYGCPDEGPPHTPTILENRDTNGGGIEVLDTHACATERIGLGADMAMPSVPQQHSPTRGTNRHVSETSPPTQMSAPRQTDPPNSWSTTTALPIAVEMSRPPRPEAFVIPSSPSRSRLDNTGTAHGETMRSSRSLSATGGSLVSDLSPLPRASPCLRSASHKRDGGVMSLVSPLILQAGTRASPLSSQVYVGDMTATADPPSPRKQTERMTLLAGRRYEYTKEDFEYAANRSMTRLKSNGEWTSEYSDMELQKRDFFQDLKRQRDKDKGRQATGPLWAHLATQLKNIADTLSLEELLEAMKLFCSVRYDDYELYMRLLGEVPHYVKQANTDQLCELIRLLARRRLRERNYVDMVAAHLLQKIRITDDALPARLLVKAGNAFAALECRSQPKFVAHFLRHMEHRIGEFDGQTCCMMSPVFVDSYMSDALRRAFLKRCAETQAGFQGSFDVVRNMAVMELVLRKEHHSFVTSLPAYVTRYLEKVKKHAQFDKWGAVALPPSEVPDGPKGNQREELSVSLQRKASTNPYCQKGDVFSSEMHRDVSACLTHVGVEHENGVLCGPYLLDIVALDMVSPAKRIVYEVNAPHHYYEGTQALTAEKRLRQRMLSRLGQKLHVVHAKDWKKLTPAQRMTFILKMQHAQQEENVKDAKQQAASNTMRTPLPAIAIDAAKQQSAVPLKLKSIRDFTDAPIRVPVPPSQRRDSGNRFWKSAR